jgi:outer membrane lipoprotein SlyB
MAFSRVVGMTLLGAAVATCALPSVASAETAAPATQQRNVDWSTINDSEPVVRLDAFGGYQVSSKSGGALGGVFGIRAAGTINHILHAGATATFYVPGVGFGNGVIWSPALEIGIDPPTGGFEIRPLVGAGVILGMGEVSPTVYPAVIIGYRDLRRKFFIGAEGRLNVFSTFQFQQFVTGITSLGVIGGYM